MGAVMVELNEDGSVNIPTPVLEALGLDGGMALELVVEDAQIILRPYEQLSAVQADVDDHPDAEIVADEKAERKQAYTGRGTEEED